MRKLLLVDVGARGGIDRRWAPFHSRIRVVAFEPDPIECQRLNATPFPYEIKFCPVALGARSGETVQLHLTRSRGCSSTLKPNLELTHDFAYADNMLVETTVATTLHRLDSIISECPDVLKVDTQGTELHVLEGAGDLLKDTIAVELEVEFIEQYLGQPLFADVDHFLRAAGFTLRGLRRSYWRHRAAGASAAGGQIVHGDALYFRKNRLNSELGHLVLAAYRQDDLLAAYGADNLVQPRRLVERMGSMLLQKLGSNREVRRFVDRLRPESASDWHDPDFF